MMILLISGGREEGGQTKRWGCQTCAAFGGSFPEQIGGQIGRERERKKKGRCTIFCEIIGDLHKIIKYWRWDDRQPQIIDPKAHIQC
jgi:hypothetical protein